MLPANSSLPDTSHTFGQHQVRAGERRTILVEALTAVMMAVEIVAGLWYGSMALLADGLHMASHAAALGVTWGAYVLARRFAADRRYSFGSGKMNSLAAYTSAMLLGLFTFIMAYESVRRLLDPVTIAFNQAILVAVVGLVVNGISVWILQGGHETEHHHGHPHGGVDSNHHDHGHDHDHNLRAAYLHVLADALTSLLAIVALLGGKYLGWHWLDPVMGLVGAALVARWAFGLARVSSRVLLDRQASAAVLDEIRGALEGDGQTRVTDLHVWSIGPGIWAGAIRVASALPRRAEDYHVRLRDRHGLVHLTIEVE